VFISEKIFSRTRRQISIKLGTNHPCVKEILVCINKGSGPFPRGDNHKKCKNLPRSLKKFFLSQNKLYFYERFLRWCRFKLAQIMVPEGQGWGHKRGNYFYNCILLK
jgi:hypothetical protein